MPKRLITKIAKLLSRKPKSGAGFSIAQEYEPEDLAEKKQGNLYFVIEIASPDPGVSKAGNIIIEIIKKEYYRDLTRDPLSSFEAALKKLNEALRDLASEGEISWLGKLNAICACLSNNTLHLTSSGSAQAFLLRRDLLTSISEGLADPLKTDPLKTFANIASGSLQNEDKLIFSTPELLYNTSLENLRKTVSQNSPTEAIGKLAEISQTEEDALGTSLIILEVAKQETQEIQEEKEKIAQEPMILYQEPKIKEEPEEEIEKAPQEAPEDEVWIDKPKKSPVFAKKITPIVRNITPALIGFGKATHKFTKHKVAPAAKKVYQKSKDGIKFLHGKTKETYRKYRAKKELPETEVQETQEAPTPKSQETQVEPETEKREAIFPEAPEETKTPFWEEGEIEEAKSQGPLTSFFNFVRKSIPQVKENFLKFFRFSKDKSKEFTDDVKSLSMADLKNKGFKRYLIIAIIAFILFASSLTLMVIKQRNEATLKKYEGILTSAQKKVELAEADLIDPTSIARAEAKKNLEEATPLLNQLINSGYKIDEVKVLLEKIQTLTDKVNGVIKVSLEVAADFNSLGENIQSFGLYNIPNELYSLNLDENTIYKFNINTGKLEAVLISSEISEKFKFACPFGTKLMIYTEPANVYQFDPQGGSELKKQTISKEETWKTAQDIAYYPTRNLLYLLSPEENQIFVLGKSLSGFYKSYNYNYLDESENINLKDGVSITISNFVYVLKSNGDILKFSRGRQVDGFKITDLPNPFSNPAKIYTNADLDNLYVADPENKRIVVFTSDGLFVKQYTSDVFSEIKGLWISEKDKTAYVLSSNKIHQFNLK